MFPHSHAGRPIGGAGASQSPVIIGRYLFRELAKPLVMILGVLVALFASYSAARFLGDAVDGLVPGNIIIELTALKVLIALEVLIPASLYASVIVSFGRLYGESEFAAMFALRVTPAMLMGAVLILSTCLALLVGGLSLFVRPWANGRLHALSNEAARQLNVEAMEAGSFYLGQDGLRVVHMTRRDGPRAPGREVFIKLRRQDGTEIISARLAYTLPQAPDERPEVELRNAYIYKIDRDKGAPDEVIEAQGVTLSSDSHDASAPDDSAIVSTSRRLLSSKSSEDVAELQWRLSTPLSTLLLGLLGIPLSRRNPRLGMQSRFMTAILIYFGYYLLFTSARTWVQHGIVAGFPGIWWVPAMLSLLVAATLYRPGLSPAR